MKACNFYFQNAFTHSLDEGSLSMYKLTYDTDIDREANSTVAKLGDTLENDNLKVELGETNKLESNINFNIIDKKFNSSNVFDFGLRYWPSYCNYLHQASSGAYAFRPIDNLHYTLTYSNFQYAYYIKGTFMQKMVLYFSKDNKKTGEKEMQAIVHVTLDQDLDVVKFDVDLDSIPTVYLDGYEVVAHFNAHNFDNNQTFWTDSNGLEMLKRQLNYRSYYDIQTHMYDYNPQNITANYYPINSAIAIKEVNGPR